MEDKSEEIRSSLGEVIEIITNNSPRQAVAKYHDYEKRKISYPLFTFRGSELQASVIDERGTDPGFPFKISDLMFLLRRGVIEEIGEKEFFDILEKILKEHSYWHLDGAIVRKKAKLIQSGEKYLLGVFGFFKLQGILNKPRKVWFEIPLSSVQQRKGEVIIISDLEICTDSNLRITNLQKNIRKKQLVAWFIDKSPNFIRFGRSLPPLFEVFPLRVSLAGGRLADAMWSIAFNQNAFFLDSLRWKKEDMGGETFIG
jgi:CRISPR-associated endonuclease/helicase Cas3